MSTAATTNEPTAPPTTKDGVIEMIRRMPDDATMHDIAYAVYVRQRIVSGLEDLDAGRVVSHEEVKERLSKWFSPTDADLMTDIVGMVKKTLLDLPVPERLKLADFIYETLPAPTNGLAEGTPEFNAMLDRRRAEFESGADPGVPADEYFSRHRRKRA